MNETYTLTIFLDRKCMSTATAFSKPKMIDLMNAADNDMKDLGYRRVSTKRVRMSKPDHTHITNYSLCYTRV